MPIEGPAASNMSTSRVGTTAQRPLAWALTLRAGGCRLAVNEGARPMLLRSPSRNWKPTATAALTSPPIVAFAWPLTLSLQLAVRSSLSVSGTGPIGGRANFEGRGSSLMVPVEVENEPFATAWKSIEPPRLPSSLRCASFRPKRPMSTPMSSWPPRSTVAFLIETARLPLPLPPAALNEPVFEKSWRLTMFTRLKLKGTVRGARRVPRPS